MIVSRRDIQTGKPRALIIGGSVGGLFAAHLLRKVGWDVAVFERATAGLESRGAAIGFTRELIEVMQRAGVRFDNSLGTRIRSYAALDCAGNVTHECRRHHVSIAWADLYRTLKDTLPAEHYRTGMLLKRIEQDRRTIVAIFADGTKVEGDLLVGADGIQSTVRQQFLPEAAPRYAGYVAWRGIVDEAEMLRSHRDLFFNHVTFCFPPGELLLCIPMPPDNASNSGEPNRRCCYVWYRPADCAKLSELFTDAEGCRHGTSIPPPLIRSEIIHDLKASAARLVAPAVARIVERSKPPLLQAVVDLESPRLVFGRAVLLGDAAFVARPHVVAGVTKAALDAKCLAGALDEAHGDTDAALARYDRERRDFGAKIVGHAREIGAHLEAQIVSNDKRPERQTDVILRDYGMPNLFDKSNASMKGGNAAL